MEPYLEFCIRCRYVIFIANKPRLMASEMRLKNVYFAGIV